MLNNTIHPAHICYLVLLETSIENRNKNLESLLEDQMDENFDPRSASSRIKNHKIAEYVIDRILV